MRINPPMKPAAGDAPIGTITFHSNPLPASQFLPCRSDQMTTSQVPAFATAAPTRPPISAWLELLGKPAYHVIKFQIIAPASAQISTSCVATAGSINPDEIVVATALPHSAPNKFVHAAISTACRGVSTFV